MSEIGELLRKLHKDKICVSSEWLVQCVEYIKEHIKPPKERLLLEIQVGLFKDKGTYLKDRNHPQVLINY